MTNKYKKQINTKLKKFKKGDRVKTTVNYNRIMNKELSGIVIDEYKNEQSEGDELHLVNFISDLNVIHTVNYSWLEKDLTTKKEHYN